MPNEGFTLLELLVVIGIFACLAGVGLFISLDVFRGYQFHNETETIISLLHQARNQSMNNINARVHGVAIRSNQYILFEAPVETPKYADRITSYDDVTIADKGTTHTGMSEIYFFPLVGNAIVTDGNLMLSSGNHMLTISANNEGQIDW